MGQARQVLRSEFDHGVADATPPMLDGLSRDLALASAGLADRRQQLLAAMQILGNIRDFLVADLSEDAEGLIDDAIEALMHCERGLGTVWSR